MRLIDADAFKAYMRGALEQTRRCYPDGGEWAEAVTEEFCRDIDEQPSLQAERKRGHWVGVMHDDGTPPRDEECWCSHCSNYAPLMPNDRPANFCPVCGADMREVSK